MPSATTSRPAPARSSRPTSAIPGTTSRCPSAARSPSPSPLRSPWPSPTMPEPGARRPALWRALGVGLIWLFLLVFLVYPLIRIFYDAVTDEGGRLTLDNFLGFFRDGFYLRALWKSLVLGVATVVASSIICIAVAFLLVRYDFRGRGIFGYLTLIPIISPPLVGTLGFTFILGRAGSINVLLMDAFDMVKPVNFLYGIHGLVLVETLH